MPITSYHAKYFAYELTRQRRGGDMDRIATSLFDAEVSAEPVARAVQIQLLLK